jgi:proteasome assembly chaperone (PAC2) family protein
LLGLAKKRGWKGICLLGATSGFGAERGVAFTLYKVLTEILEANTEENLELKENIKSDI